MTFFFGLLDILLTSVMLYDTLGLVYQFRKQGDVDRKEYLRISLSWILFLSICNLFSCNMKGFFGILFRLIIFLAKAFVTIPIFNGTLKIHKYLVEDRNAEKWYKQILEIAKAKCCKGCPCASSCSSSVSSRPVNTIGETVTPQ